MLQSENEPQWPWYFAFIAGRNELRPYHKMGVIQRRGDDSSRPSVSGRQAYLTAGLVARLEHCALV
jgi:hypothetical protein